MPLPTVAQIISEVREVVKDTSFMVPKMWSPETVFTYGDLVRPTSGTYAANVYLCQGAGISGSTEPSWPASGTVADNGITWAYSVTVSSAIASVLLGFLNDECSRVSRELLLPPLETFASVTTSLLATYVNMPSTYHRNLYAVYDSTNEHWLDNRYIYRDYESFITVYHDLDARGDIVAVCVKDGVLHYRFWPETAVNLALYYYKRITELSDMTDTPVCFPDHLDGQMVQDLLSAGVIHRCLKRIYRTNQSSGGMIQEYQEERTKALKVVENALKTETPTHPQFAPFVI